MPVVIHKDPVTEAQIEVGTQTVHNVDVKRLYLPVVITAKCPVCGKQVKHDLKEHYLSYPAFNATETVGLMCFNDDDECCSFSVNVAFGFTATLVTP